MTSSARTDSIVDVFEQAASSYDRTEVSYFKPFGTALVSCAGIRPGDHVLDVGCGRGAVLLPAAEATGPTGHVTGIDLAPTMVTLTADDVARAGLTQVEVRLGDAQQPSFAPHSFVAATDALAAHLPAELPRPAPTVGPFNDEQTITATMTAAGLDIAAISEHRVESRFHDVNHWMRWMWSHGGRELLQHLPADRLDAATADAARALESARTPEGDLSLTTAGRITVAVPRLRGPASVAAR